jgi:hypothetical protein
VREEEGGKKEREDDEEEEEEKKVRTMTQFVKPIIVCLVIELTPADLNKILHL